MNATTLTTGPLFEVHELQVQSSLKLHSMMIEEFHILVEYLSIEPAGPSGLPPPPSLVIKPQDLEPDKDHSLSQANVGNVEAFETTLYPPFSIVASKELQSKSSFSGDIINRRKPAISSASSLPNVNPKAGKQRNRRSSLSGFKETSLPNSMVSPAKKPSSQRSLHGVPERTLKSDSEPHRRRSNSGQTVSIAKFLMDDNRNRVDAADATSTKAVISLSVHSKRQIPATAHPTRCPVMPQKASSLRSEQVVPATAQPTRRPLMPQKASSLRSVEVVAIRRRSPRSLNFKSTSMSSRSLSSNAKIPAFRTSKSESVNGVIPRILDSVTDELPGSSSHGCRSTHKSFYGVSSYHGNSSLPNLFDDTFTSTSLSCGRSENNWAAVYGFPSITTDIKKQRFGKKEFESFHSDGSSGCTWNCESSFSIAEEDDDTTDLESFSSW
jgi:hypothetical protein